MTPTRVPARPELGSAAVEAMWLRIAAQVGGAVSRAFCRTGRRGASFDEVTLILGDDVPNTSPLFDGNGEGKIVSGKLDFQGF